MVLPGHHQLGGRVGGDAPGLGTPREEHPQGHQRLDWVDQAERRAVGLAAQRHVALVGLEDRQGDVCWAVTRRAARPMRRTWPGRTTGRRRSHASSCGLASHSSQSADQARRTRRGRPGRRGWRRPARPPRLGWERLGLIGPRTTRWSLSVPVPRMARRPGRSGREGPSSLVAGGFSASAATRPIPADPSLDRWLCPVDLGDGRVSLRRENRPIPGRLGSGPGRLGSGPGRSAVVGGGAARRR